MLMTLTWFNQYVALPEILWTCFGLTGFFFAYKNLRDAWDDLDAVPDEEGHFMERALALGHIRTEAFRLIIHMCSIAIGLSAMMTPPANTHNPVSTLAIIVTIGLFIINGVTVLQSVLDRRLRRELTEALERAEHVQETGQAEQPT